MNYFIMRYRPLFSTASAPDALVVEGGILGKLFFQLLNKTK